MTISWIQAILLAVFAICLSMPGMGGSTGTTLVVPIGGRISGLNSWRCDNRYYGKASSRLYRLVTPGETVPADVRAIYIGVPCYLASSMQIHHR